MLLKGLKQEVASRVFEKRPQTFLEFVNEARKVETNINMYSAAATSSSPSSKDIKDMVDLFTRYVSFQQYVGNKNRSHLDTRSGGYETDTESIQNGQLVPVCSACGSSGHLKRTCRFRARDS